MAATSEIEKLERRHAENPQGRYFAPLADAYRKAGQVDQALVLVRSGLENHPDYLSAHIVLGRCQLDLKDDPGAAQAFQRVLSLDAENIIALKSLSEIAERQSDLVQARTWLQKLLQVDPMNAEAEADLQRLGGALSTAATTEMEAISVEEAASPETSFADVLPAEARPSAAAALGLEPTAVGADEQPPAAAVLDGMDAVEFTPPTEPVAAAAEGLEEVAEGAGDAWQVRSSLATPAPDLSAFEMPAEEPGAWAAAAPEQPESPFSLPDATDEVLAGEGEAAELEMPELAPAEMAAPGPALTDLPIILPEEVAPPAELARPAAAAAALEGLPIVGEAGVEPPVAEAEAAPLLTETMGDLYLRQGFRAEAADVYRRLLEQRPGDGGLLAKLASIEGPPPSLSAASLGSESARSWLSRLAQSRVAGPAAAPAPVAAEGPSPLDGAFAQPEAEPAEPTGEPTHPAQDTFTLDAIFGAQGAAPAPPAPEPAPPQPQTGTSFDEFFGAPPEQASVRPDTAQPAAAPPLEDDVSSFNSWLRGLKR